MSAAIAWLAPPVDPHAHGGDLRLTHGGSFGVDSDGVWWSYELGAGWRQVPSDGSLHPGISLYLEAGAPEAAVRSITHPASPSQALSRRAVRQSSGAGGPVPRRAPARLTRAIVVALVLTGVVLAARLAAELAR